MSEADDPQATPGPATGGPQQLLEQLASGEITYSEVGDRIGLMLQHANEWAEQMTSDAGAEAAKIRTSAKAASKKMVADAEAEAIRIVGEAEAEAVRRIEHARRRVEELKERVELARFRTGSLKARLRGALEQLEEHDYDIELPSDLPELPEVDVSEAEHDTEKNDAAATSSSPEEVSSRGRR